MKKLTTKEFIDKSIQIHSDKYNYSKVDYKRTHEKICIICKKHGEFWQTPSSHLSGKGCFRCNKPVNDTDSFISESKNRQNDYYDYSKVIYSSSKEKVCIICKEHGEFWQYPYLHLQGCGCPKCGGRIVTSLNEFIIASKLVHCDKYDYSKSIYNNTTTKVCIICPEHGEFWQTPNSHLNGSGCPICKESRLEREISKLLDKHNITYSRQMSFNWLYRQSLDFYLPLHQIGIECQGEQHFKSVNYHEPKEFGAYKIKLN